MTLRLSNPSFHMNGRLVIHVGDVIERLRDMADNSVDQVITSPPYWGLRDYGTAFWVGGDPDCKHRPIAATRAPWANAIKGPNGGRTIAGFRDQSRARYLGGHCALCGAERKDYQIGLESTLGLHIEVLVEVFAEVHRILKPTGSLWVNYGDCYAAEPNGRSAADTKAAGDDDRTFRDKPFSTVGPIYVSGYEQTPRYGQSNNRGNVAAAHGGRVVAGGVLKPKDLCMIPARLAIALQEWGWYLRSQIVWGKTNPMPDSSGNGRPSTSHEMIYLLTKSAEADVWMARDTGELSMNPDLSERCAFRSKRDKETGLPIEGAKRWIQLGSYYDASAVMQPSSPNTHPRLAQNVDAQAGSDRAHAGGKRNGAMKAVASKIQPVGGRIRNNHSMDAALKDGAHAHAVADKVQGLGRLLRNYEPAPRVFAAAPNVVWPIATVPFKEAHFATFPPELVEVAIAAGCPPDNGVVLDPFGGAGTTALVALRMGRRAELIELKPEYVDLTLNRIAMDWMGEEERRIAEGRQRHDKLKAEGKLEPLPLIPEAAE